MSFRSLTRAEFDAMREEHPEAVYEHGEHCDHLTIGDRHYSAAHAGKHQGGAS